MTFVECMGTHELLMAWPIVRQLRDALSENEYLARVAAARREGYQLFVLMQDELPVGAIGWRIVNDLASGKSLYVDDLVVDAAERSRSFGSALIGFARERARNENCDAIRLSSNLSRVRAHTFYEREGFDRRGYAFRLVLGT